MFRLSEFEVSNQSSYACSVIVLNWSTSNDPGGTYPTEENTMLLNIDGCASAAYDKNPEPLKTLYQRNHCYNKATHLQRSSRATHMSWPTPITCWICSFCRSSLKWSAVRFIEYAESSVGLSVYCGKSVVGSIEILVRWIITSKRTIPQESLEHLDWKYNYYE